MKYVKAIDPKAFISVSNVMGVYGLGFDTLKGGSARRDRKTGKPSDKKQKNS